MDNNKLGDLRLDARAHKKTDLYRALEVRVRGRVQGVGFRPCVYQVASDLGLTGWVRNDSEGVLLWVEGDKAVDFTANLKANLPPLAVLDALEAAERIPAGFDDFRIVLSDKNGQAKTRIPADAATCQDCIDDIFEPGNRREGYAFTNCTNCGPRYTITHTVPYDRAKTSMAPFQMCSDCQREYDDPLDRRFHAQPNACPKCGPQLSHSIEDIADVLSKGGVLALKGLGGFHLVTDARNEQSVSRLRQIKDRDGKPFAIMVADEKAARTVAQVSKGEAELLTSCTRPIVVLRMQDEAGLAQSVSSGLPTVGVMLPYLPLHHLLFAALAESGSEYPPALVMTSANIAGYPLLIDDKAVHQQLGDRVDLVVTHNRAIVTRVDDTVMRQTNSGPIFLRRARSYAPDPIKLPIGGPTVVALGGHQKATVCVTRGDEAFVSQHIGDLDTPATRAFYRETLSHLIDTLDVEPSLVVADGHPDFGRFALQDLPEVPVLTVQHHHAHIAAVLAEHGVLEPAIGLALDGFGLGENGSDHWGCERLLVDGTAVKHLGGLKALAQPGGDRAAKEPWRMGVSLLSRLGRTFTLAERYGDRPGLDMLVAMIERGVNAPMTSSAGRMFDAISSLTGICHINRFEGEAAMALEAMVSKPEILTNGWRITYDGTLDLDPLCLALLNQTPEGAANLFHGTLAAALVDWAITASENADMPIALGGGCFQNRALVDQLIFSLTTAGKRVLTPSQLPANDGALSVGQAFIGLQHLASCTAPERSM